MWWLLNEEGRDDKKCRIKSISHLYEFFHWIIFVEGAGMEKVKIALTKSDQIKIKLYKNHLIQSKKAKSDQPRATESN